MRKLVVLLAAMVIVTAGAVSALAAVRTGATYRGIVADYLNNGPRWHTQPTLRQRVSFRVSADGRHVLDFVGHYFDYCGAGTSTITARSLTIIHGRFSGTGRRANPNGINYYSVSGRFGSGATATVAYQDDFVYRGRRLSDPYSATYHRPAVACESRATGTVRAG
jgi:hypothetical protein